MTDRAYLRERAEPSLAEIHQKMSELLDKQVNAQKEKLLGFTLAPTSPRKKYAMKMKETNKKKMTCE